MNLLTKKMPGKGELAPRGPRPLIHRESRAIHYYMIGMTKKDALVKAGYSQNTARANAESVFGREVVAKELAKRQLALRKKQKLSEEWVIERYMKIADAGVVLAKFKKVLPSGKLDWDFTGATEEELGLINDLAVTATVGEDGSEATYNKIGTSDPLGALNSLARVQGMFKDKVSFEGEVSLVDRITRGRERARITIDNDPEEGNDD